MSPLARGWEVLTRYPALILPPIFWELMIYGLFGRTLAPALGRQVTLKLLLPPSLPSGAELLGQAPSVTSGSQAFVPGAFLVGLLMVLGALVTAGYLHLLTGALQDEAPSWRRFAEGVSRFGSRLLLWKILVAGALLVLALFALGLGPGAALLLLAFLVLSILFYLVDFLIVVEDTSLTDAFHSAPRLLRRYLRDLGPIFLVSAGLAAVLSLLLSSTGLNTIFLASPLWAWVGTWTALAVVVVVDDPPLE